MRGIAFSRTLLILAFGRIVIFFIYRHPCKVARDFTYHDFHCLGALPLPKIYKVPCRLGCAVFFHTRPTYAHMDPPGGLVYVLPEPDLVGHNALKRHWTLQKMKGLHDIMVNIIIKGKGKHPYIDNDIVVETGSKVRIVSFS
ncbi:uncharacterized protein LOC111438622 [Cucurbita moschata]|uniref:Uncharacterized protein LOC111438622 n=1 Tax=Cucurbita moschata TaxID=3662 RepID=A0A6J1EWJ0_CUCMO|nr:uncharacterized protein LOC111438622 [Cucurbita moschata]